MRSLLHFEIAADNSDLTAEHDAHTAAESVTICTVPLPAEVTRPYVEVNVVIET